MSQTYAILPPPYHVKSSLTGTLADDVPKVNWFCRTGAESGGFKGRVGALIIALGCCLAVVTSGCGSGFSGSASGALQVSPGTVDFGDVSVGQLASSSVTISNQNLAPIAISQMSVSAQTFSIASTGKFPISIPPGGTHTVSVGFTPVSTDDYSGDLTMVDAMARPIAQIPMHGRGRGNAQLTLSAATLSFGNTMVNSYSTQMLTLTCNGTSAVTVSAATISGAGFSITEGSLPVTLGPGQSTTLQVQFKPATSGSATGQLAISSDANSGSTTVVALEGTAAAPASASQLTVSATTLDFGNPTVNSYSTRGLTLTSSGTSAVTVNAATISGVGFYIIGQSFPVTLSPGQSLTLKMQFKPTVTGSATGQVALSSDANSGSTTVVTLEGTAAAPGSASELTVSAATLSFGNTTVNSAATQALTLTSSGTSAVTVSAATISGAGFSIIGGSLPVTLGPGQSMTLQVQFEPMVTGSATGQITISSDSSSGSSTVVTLSGTGAAIPHEVDLSWNAPVSSPDPVSGYNVYRAIGSGSFQRINISVQVQTTYVDSTVSSGVTYNYEVRSVDSGGVESDPSNQAAVTIP